MIWNQVWLFPDPDCGWKWADKPIVGVPALVRVLVALKRAGIATVNVDHGADISRSRVEEWASRWDLPRLLWPPAAGSDKPHPVGSLPTLAIRWGVIFSPKLLQWFERNLDPVNPRPTCAVTADGQAFMLSTWLQQGTVPSWCAGPLSERPLGVGEPAAIMEEVCAPPPVATAQEAVPSSLAGPDDILCRRLEELIAPGGDRALLGMVGKPTDRWHVVWVRDWSFGGLRWLAERRFTPNQVTLLGFLVAVMACVLLASGRYWTGILGALLLYGSWVLDCMDGTLARLTFTESPFGQKLDTVLGHITNLAIFSALIWAVYGYDRWWKVVLSTIFMLGGILMAYRLSEEEKKLRPATGAKRSLAGLERFLDKINHRDYAVVILALAVLNGFKWFLWVSLVGVQVFWLIHLWLIHQHRRAKGAT